MVWFCPVWSQNLASQTHPGHLPPLASFLASFATQASSVPSLLFEQYHPSLSLGFNYAHKENRDQAPPTPMLSILRPRKKPLGRAQYTALFHEILKSLTLNNCGTGYQTALPGRLPRAQRLSITQRPHRCSDLLGRICMFSTIN